MSIGKISRGPILWTGFGALALAGLCLVFLGRSIATATRSEAVGIPLSAPPASLVKADRLPVTASRKATGHAAPESLAGLSRAEAQELLDRWKLESASRLLDRIQRFHADLDEASLKTATMALTYSLKHTSDPQDAAGVAATIRDSRSSLPLRMELLQPLVLAGTKECFAQILEIFHRSEEPLVRDAVTALLPQMQGEYRISSEREDLTPSLIIAFQSEPEASPLLGPLATLTAGLGSEEGISFLLDQVFAKPMTIEELESSEDPRLDVSLKALLQVYRPEAVRPVAKLLEGYDPANPRVHLAGRMLARIADRHASEVLVDYASHAPAEFEGIIAAWLLEGNVNAENLEALMAQKSFASREVSLALWQTLERIKPAVSGGLRASAVRFDAGL